MNHNRTRTLLAPLAASALVLSLAACGSDDDSSSDTVAEVTETTAMADDMASDTTMADDMADDMAEMPGGEATVGDISVSGVWMREPAEGQTRTAAYGTITNDGDADVTLVGVSVPFDATVEIHETIMGDDGAMQMQEVPEGFVVPAGGSFTLEPGGPHIMLIDIDPADITGTIEVTMVFDDGTEVTVGAPVRPLVMDAMDDMEGEMDDDMDDDMSETTEG
ncbi:MAG TPA: copper chaperone PCu(A)C [Ilumatobacteraceae bacterium]|nr:copper chaperone PCu(A)C [Ilumatobacteraceae bacterium]